MMSEREFEFTIYNSLPYPIDVVWLNYEGKEVVYKSNLAPREEYTQSTFFTHPWIFKVSGEDTRLEVSSNGITEETFEGSMFRAEVNSTIHIELSKG